MRPTDDIGSLSSKEQMIESVFQYSLDNNKAPRAVGHCLRSVEDSAFILRKFYIIVAALIPESAKCLGETHNKCDPDLRF